MFGMMPTITLSKTAYFLMVQCNRFMKEAGVGFAVGWSRLSYTSV
jgi:hypothetical protein